MMTSPLIKHSEIELMAQLRGFKCIKLKAHNTYHIILNNITR